MPEPRTQVKIKGAGGSEGPLRTSHTCETFLGHEFLLGPEENYRATPQENAFMFTIPPSHSGGSQVPEATSETRGYKLQTRRVFLCAEKGGVITGNMYWKDLFDLLNLWQPKWNNMRWGLKLVWIIYNLQQRLVRHLSWQGVCESSGKGGTEGRREVSGAALKKKKKEE